MSVLSVRNVGKKYRIRREARMITKELLLRLLGRPRQQEFWALKEINLDVQAGESLGIIGPNGSGKSTLLKIIAGVTSPTEGEVSVEGRISSLLELGAGFHPYLTGRENVYLNGAILGISKEEIDRKFDDILEFAGIDRFIDTPVKDYSSGMYVRLAFSVAIHSDPDIFLVDEVLAVGDEEFQRRCRAKIGELRESGKTIVFVSHDLNIVNELCDRVVLLQGGKIIQKGSPEETVDFYLQSVGTPEGMASLCSGTLELIFNNGRIALFNKERLLTVANGGYTSIESRGLWYDSTTADWHIDSISENELVATGAFTRIPISQTWRIKLETPSTVRWDVEMEGTPSAEISRRHLSLMLSREYRRWFTDYDEGEFPNIDVEDANWTPLCPEDKRLNAVAVISDSEQARTSPIHFEAVELVPWSVLQVFNSHYALNVRILSIMEARPHDQKALPAGPQIFASARINVGESAEILRKRLRGARSPETETLKNNDLTLVFENGRFGLFWRDREVTKGHAGHSSILQGGLWHDSLDARWQVEGVSGVELRATGTMPRLPAEQIWILRWLEDGTIEWEIHLDVKARFEMQEMAVGIMLTPEYDQWATSHESGVFPPIAAETNERAHLAKVFESSGFVEARCGETCGHDMPSVRLYFGEPTVASAVNSSGKETARVVQGLKTHAKGSGVFESGYHEVFSANILVGKH